MKSGDYACGIRSNGWVFHRLITAMRPHVQQIHASIAFCKDVPDESVGIVLVAGAVVAGAVVAGAVVSGAVVTGAVVAEAVVAGAVVAGAVVAGAVVAGAVVAGPVGLR